MRRSWYCRYQCSRAGDRARDVEVFVDAENDRRLDAARELADVAGPVP
jgi:hypothetical protein